MKILDKRVYRFGQICLDPSQGCLKLNDQEQYLRQKAFQLLLYLLEHRSRLVTKEELIQEVWEGTAVTDDALVQLIKEVRRSLGDDPRRPRFIKTVPKVGYRFIGPVEELIGDVPAVVETKEITTVEVDYEVEENGTHEREDAAIGRIALPSRGIASPRLRVVLFAAPAAILIAAIALVVYLRPVRRSLPEMTLPQVAGRRTVAVMHFENLSYNHELDWLREGLADMLITDLSRSTKLTVLGRQQLHLLLERLDHDSRREIKLEDALEIAQSSHAEVIVLGGFATVGDAIHISVQLYDAPNNQALASERMVINKPKDIMGQVDLLSLKLAAHLGASSEGQETARGLTEAITNNLEAYRCYSLGVEKAYGLHNAEAIALLERAVRLDPQFAMAYARIGYAYAVRWSFGEKARPYLEKAFQLSDRLTEKDRLTITGWYSIANFDYPAAIRTFQDIVTRYPLEVEAYSRLAQLLQGEEMFEEALDVTKRGLAVDAEAKELYNQAGGIYLDLHRFDEAIESYRRYVVLAPNEPNAHDSLGTSYQAIGRYDEAIQSYDRALALKPDFEVALIHLANVYFQQGRYREAINCYQRYIQIAPSELEGSRGYAGLCEVYLRTGQVDRAEAAADNETKLANSHCWRSLVIALDRRQESKVKRLENQFFASFAINSRGARETPRFYYYCRGYLEFKSGRSVDAIENFQQALKHRPPYWNIETFEDCLGNAYLDLGRFDEAIVEYQRILGINSNYPLAHYHLAQAYERAGNFDRARAEYGEFLQVWKNADSNIPEVMVARKRLTAEP